MFQSFLDWFRSKFPYFHNKCNNCGVSCKDDPVPPPGDVAKNTDAEREVIDGSAESSRDREGGDGDVAPDGAGDDDFSFLGHVHPTPAERLGNATRTELHRCRWCSSHTRFPRYDRALRVTFARRGR